MKHLLIVLITLFTVSCEKDTSKVIVSYAYDYVDDSGIPHMVPNDMCVYWYSYGSTFKYTQTFVDSIGKYHIGDTLK